MAAESFCVGCLQVIESQAAVLGCNASVSFEDLYPALFNDHKMYEHIKTVGNVMLGRSNVLETQAIMAGEDFSFYREKVPGAMLHIGVGHEDASKNYMVHSPHFNLNEDVLPLGAALNTAMAEMYLQSAYPGVSMKPSIA